MKDFEGFLPLNISDELENGQLYFNEEIGRLALVVDVTKDVGPSNSGKTKLVSTSRQAKKIESLGYDDLYLSWNFYKY